MDMFILTSVMDIYNMGTFQDMHLETQIYTSFSF